MAGEFGAGVMGGDGIFHIDFERRFCVLMNGERLPITSLLDCRGQETSDLGAVMSFVAGPKRDGDWLVVRRGADSVEIVH